MMELRAELLAAEQGPETEQDETLELQKLVGAPGCYDQTCAGPLACGA